MRKMNFPEKVGVALLCFGVAVIWNAARDREPVFTEAECQSSIDDDWWHTAHQEATPFVAAIARQASHLDFIEDTSVRQALFTTLGCASDEAGVQLGRFAERMSAIGSHRDPAWQSLPASSSLTSSSCYNRGWKTITPGDSRDFTYDVKSFSSEQKAELTRQVNSLVRQWASDETKKLSVCTQLQEHVKEQLLKVPYEIR